MDIDIALIFPVPDEGTKEVEMVIASPEIPGNIKPAYPGTYLRQMPEGHWDFNDFLGDYWANGPMSFFAHEVQETKWQGVILIAVNNLLNQVKELKEKYEH